MEKKSAGNILICLTLLFATVAFSGCVGQLKSIETSVNIPYHGSTTQVGVFGSAGTLYCHGLIQETAAGVDYIELDWTADVIFPADGIIGYIDWSDTWAGAEGLQPTINPGSTLSMLLTMNPGSTLCKLAIMSPEGKGYWCGEKGLDTTWEMEMKIYRDDMHFSFRSTTHGVHDEFWLSEYSSGAQFGYNNIIDGSHDIASFFASDECNCNRYDCGGFSDYEIQIQTPAFKLVKDGANFWFE